MALRRILERAIDPEILRINAWRHRRDIPLLGESNDPLIALEGGASRSATIVALSPGSPNHIALSMDGAVAASTGSRGSRTRLSSGAQAQNAVPALPS